jgi:hypothetical protein
MARKNMNSKCSPIKRFLVRNSQKVEKRTCFDKELQETLSEQFTEDSEDHYVIDDLDDKNYNSRK